MQSVHAQAVVPSFGMPVAAAPSHQENYSFLFVSLQHLIRSCYGFRCLDASKVEKAE
jgi:hypothetical protein